MMRDGRRTPVFLAGLAGVLMGALLVSVLPVMAAQVGDPLALGEVNRIDDRTDWKGGAKGAVVQVKNTASSSAIAAKADRQAIVVKATGGPVALNARAQRVAVKIRVDDGFPPIKVNKGAGTAKNLSADLLDGKEPGQLDVDRVDGWDADSLVRVAFDAVDDLPDGSQPPIDGGSGEVLTADITAPTAGWLVISAGVDAADHGIFGGFRCVLWVDGAAVTGTAMVVEHDPLDGVNEEEDCTTHGVQEVAAGNHTVQLHLDGVGVSLSLGAGSLSVLFVPFDGSGAASGP